MPDCGDNSCLYRPRDDGGMRTNGGCRCDECPRCGVPIRPKSPRSHRVWCSTPGWVPEHHSDKPPVEWTVHPSAQLQHAKQEATDALAQSRRFAEAVVDEALEWGNATELSCRFCASSFSPTPSGVVHAQDCIVREAHALLDAKVAQ